MKRPTASYLFSSVILGIVIGTCYAAAAAKSAIVIGAGPVGLFACLQLLSKTNLTVELIEKRNDFVRPQVVRIPYAAAINLPLEIQRGLWPDDAIRNKILGNRQKSDPDFWDRGDYMYYPQISIKDFQERLADYVKRSYAGRFKLTMDDESSLKSVRGKLQRGNYSGIFVAAGLSNIMFEMREQMGLMEEIETDNTTRSEIDRHGVYGIFQTRQKETHQRGKATIKAANFGPHGFTYCHSNNANNDVQLYTYPFGGLVDVYRRMPSTFVQTAGFTFARKAPVTFDLDAMQKSKRLDKAEVEWLRLLKSAVSRLFADNKIDVQSLDKIQLYYSKRSEYFYRTASGKLDGVATFFVGDSVGSTDYKLGMSLGRGLLAAEAIVDNLVETKLDWARSSDWYNKYWNLVVLNEFDQKKADLHIRESLTFKYLMHRRVVDGTKLSKLADYQKMKAKVKKAKGAK